MRQGKLHHELVQAGLISQNATWSKFSGGRSNSVWKVKSDDGLVCVKLYQENWNNPLYSNNSLDELVCLTALHDKRICPQPIAHVKTAYGDCLIYDHVTGKTTTDEVEKVAATFAMLHQHDPIASLPRVASTADALIQHTYSILSSCSDDLRNELIKLRPKHKEEMDVTWQMLHRDPTPNNILVSASQCYLIDWQSPGLGHPVEDLCHFLSPAMRILYGAAPISTAQRQAFIAAYCDHHSDFDIHTLDAMQAFYHWRLAAYCAWKISQGNQDYSKGLDHEIALLKEF